MQERHFEVFDTDGALEIISFLEKLLSKYIKHVMTGTGLIDEQEFAAGLALFAKGSVRERLECNNFVLSDPQPEPTPLQFFSAYLIPPTTAKSRQRFSQFFYPCG